MIKFVMMVFNVCNLRAIMKQDVAGW
jgi:hypothetical protein